MSGYDKDRRGYVLNDDNLIRIQDKNNDDKVRISLYEGDEREDHKRTTINYDSKTGKGTIDEHDENGNKENTTDVSCYLTTSCMKHYMDEFDDNCYYLDMLRWFRDNYVSLEDKETYYKIAPKVVEVLNRLDNSNELYNDIYKDIIQVCVRLIEYGKYKETYNIYKNSILELEDKYIKELVLN